MTEIISGLMCAVDEEIVGSRIAQCALVSSYLRTFYDFPIFSGGHAIYIAADQVLPSL
jgi:tryptophanase